jgi:hypothetical protein
LLDAGHARHQVGRSPRRGAQDVRHVAGEAEEVAGVQPVLVFDRPGDDSAERTEAIDACESAMRNIVRLLMPKTWQDPLNSARR